MVTQLSKHQTKNPQHPYYLSAKQSQRMHFSHIPEGNFRDTFAERFNLALKEGRIYV